MANLNYPELSPQQAKKLLGQEVGTQFNTQDRMFQYWDNGSVLDMGTWMHADMKEMLRRDGQASALEAVLTLPIRQADWAIMPAKGDKGEAEFVRSVLLQSAHAGGMKTPMQQVIGQATAAQIYRAAFFLATPNSRRYSRFVRMTGRLSMTSWRTGRRLRVRFGVKPIALSLMVSGSSSGSSADKMVIVRLVVRHRGTWISPRVVVSSTSTENTANLYRAYLS